MPMTTLTLLQLAGMSCAYLAVTVGLPAFVFGRRLTGHRLQERFMIYFIAGNFFVMNLVFLLQLLKISCPATLVIGTVVPAVSARIAVDRVPVRRIASDRARDLRRLAGGQLGVKSACYRTGRALGRQLGRFFGWIGWIAVHRTLDCVLTACVLAALAYVYGGNLVQELGYKMSDVPVHNYWINALGENNIFVAGVYPYGFHCILYYLHAVFGFDTYVLLRVFAFVENVMIHMMLLCFLRLCCRTRYAAYAGVIAYILCDLQNYYTYYRYCATLPQEFGMLFIFPAVYFGFAFFAARKKELEETGGGGKTEKLAARRSFLYLAGFAMSFAMTLSVHFYGTMIAGIFCVAMALGYAFLFFRKKYFWNVAVTCAVSVFIAVLPMAAAFVGGTPLEGSLIWGMNVMKGAANQTGTAQVSGEAQAGQDGSGQSSSVQGQQGGGPDDSGQGGQQSAADGSAQGQSGTGADSTGQGRPGTGADGSGAVSQQVPRAGLAERVWGRLRGGFHTVQRSLYAIPLNLPEAETARYVLYSFGGLILLGVVFFLLRQSCYGAMLISSGLYLFFMSVLIAAGPLGLPSIMDSMRASIYFAYSLPLAAAFLIDGVLCLVLFPVRHRAGAFIADGLSFVCVFCVAGAMWQGDCIKEPRKSPGQEMNEAITCLTNIIHSERDDTWTICSAGDETQMGKDHGFHYEISTFLQAMENPDRESMIRIPTPVVYFFIEKVPLDYYVQYAGSGQAVSGEGASRALPSSGGTTMYQGENRWITMSRMYYWAQEFKRLYPNEMQVYLETENFVCYRVEQNMHRLYNFAIDYGYNVVKEKQADGIPQKFSEYPCDDGSPFVYVSVFPGDQGE